MDGVWLDKQIEQLFDRYFEGSRVIFGFIWCDIEQYQPICDWQFHR